MSTSTPDEGRCYLLELSPELRNEIWHYVLPSETELNPGCARWVNINKQAAIIAIEPDELSSFEEPPALLKVNKQIRSETTPIYYGSNTIVFDFFFQPDVIRWNRWWATFGSNVQHMRKLTIFGSVRYRDSSELLEFYDRFMEIQHIAFGKGTNNLNVAVESEVQAGQIQNCYVVRDKNAEKHGRILEDRLRGLSAEVKEAATDDVGSVVTEFVQRHYHLPKKTEYDW